MAVVTYNQTTACPREIRIPHKLPPFLAVVPKLRKAGPLLLLVVVPMAQSARVGDISLPRLSTVLITVSPAAANLTMTEASRVNAAGTFDAKWVELVCSFTCKRPRESDIKDTLL